MRSVRNLINLFPPSSLVHGGNGLKSDCHSRKYHTTRLVIKCNFGKVHREQTKIIAHW